MNHLQQSRLQIPQLLLNNTSIHHKQENITAPRLRLLMRSRSLVLDSRILREQLSRKILLRNGLVMRRKVVALEAETADPYLVDGREIDDREGVDHGSAAAASERGVR